MARIDGEGSELLQISPDERARAARSAALFSEEDLTRFLQIMLRTFDELNYRQEQRFHLELGLIKLVHLGRLLPVEEFLSKLPVSASGKAPSSAPARPQSAANRPSITSGPVTSAPVRPAEPPKPVFSPFEADKNRKIQGDAGASVATTIAPPAPRTLTPLETASRAGEVPRVKVPSAPVPEPAAETTAGALALATESVSMPETATGPDLDRLRTL